MMTRRIVVGVDGSPASLAALSWAAEEARPDGASLVAVTALPGLPPEGSREGARPEQTALPEAIMGAVHRALSDGDRVDHEIRRGGGAADVLIEESARADLLVVGSRGGGGFRSLRIGSVSRACLHGAHCPVAVVRPESRGLGRLTRRRRVVAGVDGSPEARQALTFAAGEAVRRGAELVAVHAVFWDPIGAEWVTPTMVQLRAWGTKLLDGVVSGVDLPVPVGQRVVPGHPAEVLIRMSRHADLLVVGSRGRGALAGLFLGSVSSHCVEHARCPVVVTRSREGLRPPPRTVEPPRH